MAKILYDFPVVTQDNIIKNDEILINPPLWEMMNTSMSRDEIKSLIISAILENNLPMPMRGLSERDCRLDFEKMKHNPVGICKGEWFTRYDYKYELSPLYFPSMTIGNKSSDYFHQNNRWLCDSINAPSPYRTWHSEKFLNTLLNALWSMKVKKVDSSTLRTMIGMRKYIASQFRPITAKQIYDHFDAVNVLDFSSGWGDRLSGFMASEATRYVGIDPNKNLHKDYQRQIEMFGHGKSVKMYCDGAENVELNEKFDLIFTSPPYFNVEKYTQDENQSWKKFKGFDNWLDGFLLTTLKKLWTNLEIGGTMAINISDVYSGHRINKICDPMNDMMKELPHARYIGCIGYEMRKRPNSGALKGKTGKFCEPIWIWRKL